MPNPTLDPVIAALGDQIKQMQARIAQLERNQRASYNLDNSSIDSGSLVINDDTGQPAVILGLQPDGSYSAAQVGLTTPNIAPADPTVTTAINGLTVLWNGQMSDGSYPLADFASLQVYCSTVPGFIPDPTTLQGNMLGMGAFAILNLTPGVTYYVITQVVNGAGNAGPPSNPISGVPVSVPASIPPGSISQAQLGFTISAGGVAVTFAPAAPASPNVNDLWFDMSNGNRLNQWNGSAWTPYQWGQGALAANSVTALTILAGTVVAGMVDGTTVTGTTVQNSTTNPKTSINPDGSITITNAAGLTVFRIGPDGTVYWFNSAGNLLQEIQPGGTQLVYASLTGPQAPINEPQQPVMLVQATSVASATIYSNQVAQAVPVGQVITVVAGINGTTALTGVSDSGGNTYTAVQTQTGTAPAQWVYQAVVTTALAATDQISVTWSAANTLAKTILAVATAGLPTVSPIDYSAQATGTSTAPSVSGTPTAYCEPILLIVTNGGTAVVPSAIPDGWQQVAQAGTAQTSSLFYSGNVASSGALAASLTLPSSQAWTAVTIGYKTNPALSFAANAPVPLNASLSSSTQWSDDGNFSIKVTKVGTATTWGLTYPAIPCQPGSYMAVRVVVGTLNIALGNFEFGFTFWSGANGTGTNLGSSFWTYGAIPISQLQALIVYNCLVPAGAQSATVYANEKQADTAGNWFLIDGVHIPGGLAYSNSPVNTIDALGNPVPQGMNFNGLPGTTNVFGVTDPYLGTQLSQMDSAGNVTGQTLSAANDVTIAGQSLLNDILPNYSLGIVTRGWVQVASGTWPSTAIGPTEQAVLELDFIVPANRAYWLMVPSTTFIPTVTANTQMIHRLKYTTDGSTPTTSSPQIANHSPGVISVAVANSGLNLATPYMEWVMPVLSVDTTYRVLLTASIQNTGNSFVYTAGSEPLEMRVMDMGNNAPVNNGVVLGTGGSTGGTGAQNYTEYFYGNNTWSYWEYGTRNHNGSIYQGAYSGEGYAQYCYIQWSTGSRGNGLNTVLNYTVKSVSIRLLNQHSWYNSGMTVTLHSSQGSPGSISAIGGDLDNWHINEGQKLTHNLGSSAWAPFKAAGTTYAVLSPHAGSQSLDYYGYFWGGGNNNGNVPMLTVNYNH